MSSHQPKEWVSIAQAVKILGIPKDEIMSCIHNMLIPFHKNGNRYTLNLKLVRAYFCRMDIENMKRGQRSISSVPLSRNKVTNNLGNNGKQGNSKIRRVDENLRY